jgi:Ice-binding-like/Bacterial Ig-like domain
MPGADLPSIEQEITMRNTAVRMIWGLAILLTGFTAGCGREQTPVTGPVVTATSPTNGATGVPLTASVTATFNEALNPATANNSTFTVTGPGATSVPGTIAYSGTTATFTPNSLLTANSMYTATITTGIQDPAGIALAANFVWMFKTGTIPTVVSTNPLNGAINVPTNQELIATFSEAMNSMSVVAAGTVTVAATGGVAVPGTVTYVTATNSVTFAPTATLLPSTHYTVTITTAAHSAAGNPLASNYVWSFTTGKTANATAPTVILTVPTAGATAVPTNQIITATFSTAMDPATITAAGTFTVTGAANAAVLGSVSYVGLTATFTPTSALPANTLCTATISTAAKNLTEIPLAANYVWSFTTAGGPDTTPPTITLTGPANGDTNVLLNSTVNATFSEAMNPLTVTASGTYSLSVAGAGGAAVAGTVTYDSVNNIATFTPSANLAPSTEYMATILSTATDLAGNPLAAGSTPNPWTFTTGASVGPTPPNLGAASTFGGFGGNAGITNQGVNTVINGDLGTTAASTLVTGFNDLGPGCIYTETGSNVGVVNGNIYTAPPPPTVGCPSEGTAATFLIATQASIDALAAYNDISPASRPGGTDPGAGQLGALVLPPGTYQAAAGSFLITGSDLTLDGQGNDNAIWVFQMASSLTVGAPGAPRSIILTNGAQPANVFWQVGSSATINAAGGGTMVGTIIASAGVTFSTAGNAAITTLDGRALSLNASITIVNTVINVPAP